MREANKWLGLAVLAGAIGLGQVRAAKDDAYDLRGPAPEKGQVYVSKSQMKVKNADLTLKAGGQTLNIKQNMTMTGEEEEKVLAVTGRQVTKSQAKVIKDEVKTVAEFGGQTMEDTKKNDLQGEVIVSERTGEGKWKHTLVDNKPTDDQKKELDKRLGPESEDDLYPAEKVKVGHTWTVNADAMKKFFGNSFTDVKGKMAQKFVKVEEYEGETCAVIESSGPIKAKMKDEDAKLDVELELKSTTWRSVKTGIDLKVKYEGKIRMAGKQKMDGIEAEIDLSGALSGEGSTKLK
jgi:hypothetical protein